MNMQRNVIRSEKPQMTGWPTKLLSVNGDAKTIKGKKYGYLSGVHTEHLRGSQATRPVLTHQMDARECLFSSGRARQFAQSKRAASSRR